MSARAGELDLLIETRRDLHRHPELAYQEHRTASLAATRLSAAGYAVRTGVAGTGVIGDLRGGGGDGPTLLLRADMDALPVQEDARHDYTSRTPGVMHACGHDAHVAILLAVAARLARARHRWPGRVRCIFQPAEETGGGASRMIREGALEGVDAALGLHVWTELPSGTVGAVAGPLMAASAEFELTIVGRASHAAMPHLGVDALLVASHVVTALQSVVSRYTSPLEPLVISVTRIQAGEAQNSIAGTAVMEGTLRTFSSGLLGRAPEQMDQVIRGVCTAFGADYTFALNREWITPPVINDPVLARRVAESASEVVGPEHVRSGADVRTLAAEDFGEYLRHVPGCFFFVGARNEAAGVIHPHHSPHFDLCERSLPIAVDVLERSALAFLRSARPEAAAHGATGARTRLPEPASRA